MKTLRSIHLIGLVGLSALGCGEATAAPVASSNVQALSAEDCAEQRDACLKENSLFGLFSCPAQFAQCAAAAQAGVAKEVTAAVAEVADCTRKAAACVTTIGKTEGTPHCSEDEAKCVASVVDVQLPKVVEGTAGCVDETVDCVNGAKSPADLTACGTKLEGCAVDQVKEVVPEEIGKVIDDVNKCRKDVNGCIAEASDAAGVTACTQSEAKCVAGSLGVELPNVPLAKAVECAEDAANCALDADSPRAVAACADGLRKCGAEVVDMTDVPEQLTCEKKWTVCVGNDPLKFLQCAAQLVDCKD